MKVEKLIIKNVGMIEDVEIILDKPLILFYGQIRQGKTTILNAVRWAFGGSFPEDIIRHGEKEASVELRFEGGSVGRSWYRARDNKSTKARPIEFIREGKPVDNPAFEIKRMLNPFLLDQDFLRNKTETERRAYFTELFAVDTKELDLEAYNAARDAQDLRSKIKAYGNIEVTPVEHVDVSELKQELQNIRGAWEEKREFWKGQLAGETAKIEAAQKAIRHENLAAEARNRWVDQNEQHVRDCDTEIAGLQKRIKEAEKRKSDWLDWLYDHPKMELRDVPPFDSSERLELAEKILSQPDTAALEAQIQNAAINNVKFEQYQRDKARLEEKEVDQAKVSALEERQRQIKDEKAAKLKGISDSCGIPGLEFDESGEFSFEGTTAGMLSTSQIMKLSELLSGLYPPGFGLDLLDRAESLGKSIFTFVERAKVENKTILATIVGEAPAEVPENVGVFVVEEGKVKS